MLSRDDAYELFDYGIRVGHHVIFTPMFTKAVDYIEDLRCELVKIRYADRHNHRLINRALDVGVPVLISVDRSYNAFYTDPQVKLLYCVPKYPAAIKDYQFTPEDFSTGAHPGATVFSGVSDHTKDNFIMALARTYGAEFCECHVMLSGTEPIEKDWSKTFEEVGEFLSS